MTTVAPRGRSACSRSAQHHGLEVTKVTRSLAQIARKRVVRAGWWMPSFARSTNPRFLVFDCTDKRTQSNAGVYDSRLWLRTQRVAGSNQWHNIRAGWVIKQYQGLRF